MNIIDPIVILCSYCQKILRDERATPEADFLNVYATCAACRVSFGWPARDEIQNRVGHPPVKADLPPSLPSPQAAASPVPDSPRDGIRLADDDGENLVFDVHLVMTARTTTEDGAHYWSGATRLVCGGSKTCASLDYRGNLHDYGLGKQLVDAIEDALAARQPRKGDE